MNRKFALTFLLILILPLAAAALWLQLAIERTEQEIVILRGEIQAQEQRKEQLELLESLLNEMALIRMENEYLRRRMQDWLEAWQVLEVEATFYSPFDDVSGLNHDGNPNITALGYTPGPGIYAVDFDVIPPHSAMWVEGEGWGLAGDAGGAIKGNRIDIYRDTYRQAMADGRQTRLAVLPR